MDKLLLSDWISLVTALGVIVALIGNLSNIAKSSRTENISETERLTRMEEKLDTVVKQNYRMEKKIDHSDMRMGAFENRLTIVEQDTKSAHKRIDTLENKK